MKTKVTKAVMMSAAMSATMAALIVAAPAQAQKVNSKVLEKTTFYNAPRELQIIDDRPVVRDFREAPIQAPDVDLPPAPGAGHGHGGGGGGALENGGAPSTIPGGGLHMPGIGTDPGYRTPQGMGLPLPKSGFGHDTNIPARGMGPRGALPDASSTNRLMGKMMNPSVATGQSAGHPRFMQVSPNRTAGNSPAPVATYSGGYGSGMGNATGGSASRTEGLVRGSLLKH